MPKSKKTENSGSKGPARPRGSEGAERIWGDGFQTLSSLADDYLENVYKPWMNSGQELMEKAGDMLNGSDPEKYRQFYDEWTNLTMNTITKFYPSMSVDSQREMLKNIRTSAEETRETLVRLTEKLNDTIQKTGDILSTSSGTKQIGESYSLWVKSYEDMMDQILSIPSKKGTKTFIDSLEGFPRVSMNGMIEMAKLSRQSYSELLQPFMDSMLELTEKMMDVMNGNSNSDSYREFYDSWLKSYQETFGKVFNAETAIPTKETIADFLEKMGVYINMYKSWISALEKMSEKTRELATKSDSGEVVKGFTELWSKAYEKAFSSFFENMPTIGPMSKMMDPVKEAARIYSENYLNFSKMWTAGSSPKSDS